MSASFITASYELAQLLIFDNLMMCCGTRFGVSPFSYTFAMLSHILRYLSLWLCMVFVPRSFHMLGFGAGSLTEIRL